MPAPEAPVPQQRMPIPPLRAEVPQHPQSAPSYLPSPEFSAPAPVASPPQQGTIPPPRIPQASGPIIVKMEPRSTRTRSTEAPEVVARPISEEHLAEHPRAEGREYRQITKSRRLTPRLLISGSALLLMIGVSAGLIFFTKEAPAPLTGPNAASKSRPILPDEVIPKSPDIKIKKTPPATPTPPAKPETATTPASPAQAVPQLTGTTAMEMVEKFLSAQNLDEREPLIETRTPIAALQDSILAKPFPANPTVTPDFQETNPTNGATDFYFNVDFANDSGKPSKQVLLVRGTTDGPPKIIVDPFLDTYGGRLMAFASKPTETTATFQLVISAVAQTTADRNVPNHENKLRLKLMPRDNEKEITSAYFTKLSKLGQMLVTEGSGFRYGQPRAARVNLRWNKEEDPTNPFLEVTDIKEFRWNP